MRTIKNRAYHIFLTNIIYLIVNTQTAFSQPNVTIQAGLWRFPKLLTSYNTDKYVPMRRGTSFEMYYAHNISKNGYLGITYNYSTLLIDYVINSVQGCYSIKPMGHLLGLSYLYSYTTNNKLIIEQKYEILFQYIKVPREIIPSLLPCLGNEILLQDASLLGIGLTTTVGWKLSQHFALTSSFRTAMFLFGKNAYQYPLQLNILFGIRYYFNKKQASHD